MARPARVIGAVDTEATVRNGVGMGKAGVIHFSSNSQTSRKISQAEIERIEWEKAETRRRERCIKQQQAQEQEHAREEGPEGSEGSNGPRESG